jgi:phosphohistidine phosphatase
MKTLFLVRHAKSSWDDPALADKDRPLGARGKRDATKMGKRLAKREVKPDLILSSPAKRALSTAEIIADKLEYQLENIVVDSRLYSGAADDLFSVIRTLDDKLHGVMLFGHNPELTELAHRLSRQITRLPTCAVADGCVATSSCVAVPAVIAIGPNGSGVTEPVVNDSVKLPAIPWMPKPLNVAEPFATVTALPLKTLPVPVVIDAEMTTPAPATGLPEASRNCTTGCWANAAPFGADADGVVVNVICVARPALSAMVPDVTAV